MNCEGVGVGMLLVMMVTLKMTMFVTGFITMITIMMMEGVRAGDIAVLVPLRLAPDHIQIEKQGHNGTKKYLQ